MVDSDGDVLVADVPDGLDFLAELFVENGVYGVAERVRGGVEAVL